MRWRPKARRSGRSWAKLSSAPLPSRKTHGQADYEELRASSLRAIRDAVQQLEQVSVALGRDVPKVSFAREVLDTIVDSLRATTKKLEDA
jgi:hypothetical protein